MKVTHVISLCAAMSLANGTKFSLPLFESTHVLPESSTRNFIGRQSQSILHNHGSPSRLSESSPHGEPPVSLILGHDYFLYTTNISLGTPPQPFRAVVDLMWNDLFVPSAECSGSHCETKAYYNSSASSSFSKNNTASRLFYAPIVASGHVNNESLTIADLVVPNQPFHELNHYDTIWPDFGHEHFDSVLGLAMDRSILETHIAQNILPSPIKRIVDEGLLDDNIFSILLPEHSGEPGDITFGGYNNEFFTGEPVSHPLFPENTTSWQIQVTSLALGDGYSATTDGSLPAWKGLLMSRYPILGFPQKVGSELLKHINVTHSRCFETFVVDCKSISELPDLTIGFTGQKITLTGEDYIWRTTAPEEFCPDAVEECVLLIVLLIDALPPVPNIPNDIIMLGSAFLKKIYGIFDWDKRTISFAHRQHRQY